MRRNSVDEVIGWYGVIAIITAYLLNSIQTLTSASIYYQTLNLTGASAIVYHSIRRKDMEPAILNILWAIIALIAIIRIFL